MMRTVSLKTLLKELHKGLHNDSRTWTMDELKQQLRQQPGKYVRFDFVPAPGKYKILFVKTEDAWRGHDGR